MTRIVAVLTAATVVVVGCTWWKMTATAPSMFTDRFDGHTLNARLWQPVTSALYNPAQVTVSDGDLRLTAHRVDGQWTSGEIVSKWTVQYGTVSFEAKLEGAGQGTYPAVWLRGTTDPSPANGEIDMFENIDAQPWTDFVAHGSGSGGHWYEVDRTEPFALDAWHTYKVVKTPTAVTEWIDGRKVGTFTSAGIPNDGTYPHHLHPAGAVWPFDTHLYQGVLDVNISGPWAGLTTAKTPATATLLVDWYKVTTKY